MIEAHCDGKRINWTGEVSEGESVWVPLTKATAAGLTVGIATAPAEGAPVAGQVAHVAVSTAATVRGIQIMPVAFRRVWQQVRERHLHLLW